MKKSVKIVLAIVLIACIACIGEYIYFNRQMSNLRSNLSDELARKEILDQRIAEIQDELNGTMEEKSTLASQVDQLLTEIDELLTVEEVFFDAEAIMEEIQEIGELATLEYRYTNVGTLDSSKTFSIVGWTVPLSTKTIVISMDGVIKIGVDVKGIEVTVNESTKTIYIHIPEAKIMSNELDETSMQVWDESNGIFNPITMQDSSSVRQQIKDKAVTNTIESGLMEQAQNGAKTMIKSFIEAIPGIRDSYTIEFK